MASEIEMSTLPVITLMHLCYSALRLARTALRYGVGGVEGSSVVNHTTNVGDVRPQRGSSATVWAEGAAYDTHLRS